MKLIDKLVWKDLIGPFFNGLFMFLLLVFAAGSLFQADVPVRLSGRRSYRKAGSHGRHRPA